ncbi:MAG TPA: hypothetical protein PLO53_05845 [Candidatus Hydrogenedentes bacterium]|nr:hypothetical protein [Candidatus Hydrogenedentota bacterium]
MKDLVVLAADKDLEFTVKGIFARADAIGIRPIEADVYVNPNHDAGCVSRGVELLNQFRSGYRHGLLIFDYEGCGKDKDVPLGELKKALDEQLHYAWGDKAKTVILDPELEIWIWSDSPHVEEVLGWKNKNPKLRDWLLAHGWLQEGCLKPVRPKEAFEAAIREARIPKSASLFHQLARKVSLQRCTDPAFRELKTVLKTWFPKETL